jgi:hypothetical protein
MRKSPASDVIASESAAPLPTILTAMTERRTKNHTIRRTLDRFVPVSSNVRTWSFLSQNNSNCDESFNQDA